MAVKCRIRIRNRLMREVLAEIIGTFILVSLTIGSNCQLKLSRGTMGNFLAVAFASGMGVTLAVYWAGGISGGSLNPAMSLALSLHGELPWRKLPFYCMAEMLGGFLAAAGQYAIFYGAIDSYDGGVRSTYGPNATAGLFATYPIDAASTMNCFIDQLITTFLLVGCNLAITDKLNMRPDSGLLPVALGSVVFGINTCWAYNCGVPMNPARDLGPRIFTSMAGWGVEPFSYRDYNYFWVPVIGPICGSVLGWLGYKFFIDLHWPEEDDDQNVEAVPVPV